MDYAVHGILQARILEWVAFPFSRGSAQPRNQTHVSRIGGRFFTSWGTREAGFSMQWMLLFYLWGALTWCIYDPFHLILWTLLILGHKRCKIKHFWVLPPPPLLTWNVFSQLILWFCESRIFQVGNLKDHAPTPISNRIRWLLGLIKSPLVSPIPPRSPLPHQMINEIWTCR